MKVSQRGRRISIRLDPKNAADQAFGDAFVQAMRQHGDDNVTRVEIEKLADDMLCPRCGGYEAFHPSPGDCGITPEEWRRGKAAQRTGVAILLRERGLR